MKTLKSVSRETFLVDLLPLFLEHLKELKAEVQGSQASTESTVSLQQVKLKGSQRRKRGLLQPYHDFPGLPSQHDSLTRSILATS